MAESKVYTFQGNDIDVMKRLKDQRGLSDADIDRLHITIIPSTETKRELDWIEGCSLIRIPYFGIGGEKLLDNRGHQLCRYRRTVVNDRGERYTQRRGTGARHYLPLGTDWTNVARDPTIPLFYTEGEFKAVTSCKHLGPTVANAGVTSWRGPRGLAAPLDDFIWRGRTVYIVYDAEATSTALVPLKSNIEKAQGELAVELTIRGATVKQLLIARTPTFKEGTKLGVDDYFLAGGSVEELMATASDPTVDESLARMFRLYAVFLGTKPHVKNIERGDVYSAREFADFIEPETRLQDNKPVKLANIYREHSDRNWFDQYIFDPALPVGFLTENHKFNLWQGFQTQPSRSDSYEEHIDQFMRFTNGVWGEHSDYYLDWSAHLFQRPWELTTISPILVSRVKGVGKSLTGAILRNLIGSKGAFVGSVDGLTEKHTGELEGKLFVQVDEADALFEGKEERLKALDSDEIRIRKMNTDGYTIRNIMRKFYTTNKNAAWRIAENERRYFVVRVRKTEDDGDEDSQWSQFLRKTIGPMSTDPEFLSNVMYYMMNRDIEHWDPKAPVPRTEDMMEMVEAGETKKETAAVELYSALSDLGIWAVDATIRGIDKKLWGEVNAILRDKGGRSVSMVYNDGGSSRRTTIWMTKDHLLPVTEDPKYGAQLRGQLSIDDVRTMLLKTRALLDKTLNNIDQTKY